VEPTHAHTGFSRGRSGRVTISSTAGFWLATAAFVLLFAGAAAPSPLYGVYQAEWGFSAIVLTAVFAVYALLLLITLLIFGSVSDYLGRRRVISVALVGNAGVCALFLTAHGVDQLFAARATQGIAVGVATSALGATLIDLQPQDSGLAPVFTKPVRCGAWPSAGSGQAPWCNTRRRRRSSSGGCCLAHRSRPPSRS
jgi:MFS family permease